MNWPSEQKSLFQALAEIAQEEKKRARSAQRRGGGSEPIKTGFKPASQLDSALNAALDRLWKLSQGDENLRRLYSMIGRGHSALSEADLFRLVAFPDPMIRKLAGWLVNGRGIKESVQKALMKGDKALPVVSEQE